MEKILIKGTLILNEYSEMNMAMKNWKIEKLKNWKIEKLKNWKIEKFNNEGD
jgi:hypothetical protein